MALFAMRYIEKVRCSFIFLAVYIVIHVVCTSQSARISDIQFISITISFLLAMMIENKSYSIHIGPLQNVIVYAPARRLL